MKFIQYFAMLLNLNIIRNQKFLKKVLHNKQMFDIIFLRKLQKIVEKNKEM